MYSRTNYAPYSALQPVHKKIQLERHKARGVCTFFGPPFYAYELTHAQLDSYRCLWSVHDALT